jgi:preprotein translocase subunit SecG
MLIIFVNVIYVLAAVAMIVLILLQRGAGAAAGSGFGGGASATVFGARGSANFLSKATKWLALVFFSISLGLAIYASRPHNATAAATTDLGVMGRVPAAAGAPAQSPQGRAVPAPAVPAPVQSAPAQTTPVNSTPAIPSPQPAAPAPNTTGSAKQGNKGG